MASKNLRKSYQYYDISSQSVLEFDIKNMMLEYDDNCSCICLYQSLYIYLISPSIYSIKEQKLSTNLRALT